MTHPNLQKFRWLFARLPRNDQRRLVILTGARQTGKTTLAQKKYAGLHYINLDAPENRDFVRTVRSAVVKTPKLYWLDIGIVRQLQGLWGEAGGELFENFVVAEIYKWVHSMAEDVRLWFYRTRSGMEVDLLLETPHGFIGCEIKSRANAAGKDLRPLRDLARQLGAAWLCGMVITRGNQVEELDTEAHLWSMPVHRLLA